MKSICIKTRSQSEANYLKKIFNKSYIDNTKKRIRKFKIYYNFIIHYFGDEENKFLYSISILLSNYIIENYEERLIKRSINKNYFYFDDFEKEVIYKISLKILELQEIEFSYKEEILTEIIYDYLQKNINFYLEGIINFRLKEYTDILDYLVEISVMNYLKFV